MGLCWKCVGGGRHYTYIYVLCWSSRSVFSLVGHWCFLVFTLPPEFGFWQCRHFWTWSIFHLLASFGLLIPFRGHLLPPREARDGFYDCAAAVPCCHSEDGWGISKLEAGDLFRRATRLSLPSHVLHWPSLGKYWTQDPTVLFAPRHLLAPLYPNPFQIVLLIPGQQKQQSSVQFPPHRIYRR